MCGIAVAVGSIDGEILGAVERMRDVQTHRGPDAEGMWHDERAVLAHRRLSIIDLSADGIQPMVDSERGLVISYNGELYNYVELRAELEGLGVVFRTRTDTEVLLRAYMCWGRDCVERFRGMYAVAVWDGKARELFLARDRLGIKPLYYTVVDRGRGRRTLLVASEVLALLESGLVVRRIEASALSTFVWHGFVNGAAIPLPGLYCRFPSNIRCLGARRTSWRRISFSSKASTPC